MEDGSHHADADPSDSSGGFETTAKLRTRVEKLAHWRVNPSAIKLREGHPESHGGHATVWRGYIDSKEAEMRDLEKCALGKKLDREATANFLREREEMKDPKQESGVAVKKMRVADDTDFERVLGLAIREAEFLAGLDHQNIVELEGFVEDVSEGTIWLVFPWADEGNLRHFITFHNWEMPEKISLINGVARGLAYLHSRNPPICHGDLKSLNVLVYTYQYGRTYAKITDFGSARRHSQHDPNINTQAESQAPPVHSPSVTFESSTKTITLTGNNYTLRWAAPELLLEDKLSLWSDIWALGWIAYEVMTESLPFEDVASDVGIVECLVQGKLPSLADDAHLKLIHELCSLMEMCWKLQPTERPTADSCQMVINEMPMVVPWILDGVRFANPDNLGALGEIYESRGEYSRAFNLIAEAVKESITTEDFREALSRLAQLARCLKNYSATIEYYDGIWKMYHRRGEDSPDDIANILCDLAELHRLRNEHNKAIGLHSEGREIQEEKRIAEALCTIAQEHQLKGRHDEAIRLYTEALEISTDLGSQKGIAAALWGLDDVHRLRGDYEKTIPLHTEALKIHTKLRHRNRRASALQDLADAHGRRGDYKKAIPLYTEALEIRTELGDKEGRAGALYGLADVHRLRGEYEKAIPLYTETLKIRTDPCDKRGRADALWGLAEVHRLRGEYDKAIPLYTRTLKIRTGNYELGRADALWGLAEVHRRRGDYEKAIPLYIEALEIRTELGDKESRAGALYDLADLLCCSVSTIIQIVPRFELLYVNYGVYPIPGNSP